MDKFFCCQSNIDLRLFGDLGMKKKKIGLLFQTSPHYGGGYQYALQAVNCLVEKAETDYEIVVLCGNTYWQKWCREKGVRFLGHPLPGINNPCC